MTYQGSRSLPRGGSGYCLPPVRRVGIAREKEAPENPGCLERRVVLVPDAVALLVKAGCEVQVEAGAGVALGYGDEQYRAVGARIVEGDDVYRDQDLILKLKGPAAGAFGIMRRGCTVLCMAHVRSIPERAHLARQHGINLIAMELITEVPERFPEEVVVGGALMEVALSRLPCAASDAEVRIAGYSERAVGALRVAARMMTRSLEVVGQPGQPEAPKRFSGSKALVMACAGPRQLPPTRCGEWGQDRRRTLDLHQACEGEVARLVAAYRERLVPRPFGLRRIQCLHEAGVAGASYGLRLLREHSPLAFAAPCAEVVVLGYGNVAMGAIDHCLEHGVKRLDVLGKANTVPERIEAFLANADLVINGAELAVEERGKRYLLTRRHAAEVLKPGAVVVDLIGGSRSNRCAVENIAECTWLDHPFFVDGGIFFSSLWGWPMMGMERESTIKYSAQIVSVLLERERLLAGYRSQAEIAPGLKQAIVCGRF